MSFVQSSSNSFICHKSYIHLFFHCSCLCSSLERYNVKPTLCTSESDYPNFIKVEKRKHSWYIYSLPASLSTGCGLQRLELILACSGSEAGYTLEWLSVHQKSLRKKPTNKQKTNTLSHLQAAQGSATRVKVWGDTGGQTGLPHYDSVWRKLCHNSNVSIMFTYFFWEHLKHSHQAGIVNPFKPSKKTKNIQLRVLLLFLIGCQVGLSCLSACILGNSGPLRLCIQ